MATTLGNNDAAVFSSATQAGGAAAGADGAEIRARFEAELELVEIIASQVSRSIDNSVDFDELMAAGREGLFDAARRFDPTKGAAFRTFANYRVEGAIIDAVRKSMRLPRRLYERLKAMEAYSCVAQGEVDYALKDGNAEFWERDADQFLVDHIAAAMTSAAAAIPLQIEDEGLPEDVLSTNPEEAYERNEILDFVRSALSELDDEERETIRLCYFEDMSFSEMAKAMNISKPWAHRVHGRAMHRLTKKMRLAVGTFSGGG
ncbi:MAG: sigma-70 family RNA polymerase sigma factor [Polyangiaceae bacterium]